MEMNTKWKEWKCCPFAGISNPICIGRNRIFIIKNGDNRDGEEFGIYQFNKNKNEWKLFSKVAELKSTFNKIAYNPTNDTINIINNDFMIKYHSQNTVPPVIEENTLFEFNENPFIVYHNGDIHSVLTSEHNVHDTLDRNFKYLNQVGTGDVFNDFDYGLIGHQVISTDDKLFVFGGFDPDQRSHSNKIFEFTSKQKWSKISHILPVGLSDFGCGITMDRKYILLCGGNIDKGITDSIYIYDLDLNLIRRSPIRCPMASRYRAIIVCDKKRSDHATFGYLRNLFNKKEMENIQCPPDYLIKLICKYWNMSYIHLYDNITGKHYGISAEDIIHASTLSISQSIDLCPYCRKIQLNAIKHNHRCPESGNVCSICNVIFDDFNQLQSHKTNHSSDVFDCTVIGCDKYLTPYKNKRDLMNHMKKIHNMKLYKKQK